MFLRQTIVTLILMVSATLALAGDWNPSGRAGVELRWFLDDAAFPGQRNGIQPSLFIEPVLEWESDERKNLVSVVPFLRLDGWDEERTHFDLREAYWRHVRNDWELLAGFNTVFWGVTEARHLVNVINQIDYLEDIDQEDWLGQPMIQFSYQKTWGRLEMFTLLGFREQRFPGLEGRLRPPVLVDNDGAVFESGAGKKRVDLALRWSHFIGDWDIGVYIFRGNGREPRLIQPSLTSETLTPYYDVITQIGLEVQYTRNAWLYKLEAIGRQGQGDDFSATVAGLEYTLYQVGSTNADVGLLAEYLYDGRDHSAPFTIFDDDIFVGARLSFNDIQDTGILAGAVVDLDDGSTVGLLEASRRVGNHFTLEVEARWFSNISQDNALVIFQQDSFLVARLSYHF